MCLGLAGTGGVGIRGYLCIPHDKQSGSLLENWKKSDNIVDIYFVTATFSEESTPYFPNKANHYILASFTDVIGIVDDIRNHKMDRLSLMFSFSNPLFERTGDKLNYTSRSPWQIIAPRASSTGALAAFLTASQIISLIAG